MSAAKHAVVHHGYAVHHAPASHAATDLSGLVPPVITLALVIGAIIGVVLLARGISRATRERKESEAQEAHEEVIRALAPWLHDPLQPIATPVGLALEPGESAYYSGNAQILAEHTQTRRVGGSAGPSFRIAKAPVAPLTQVSATFYGTTDAGGTDNVGTVFALTP